MVVETIDVMQTEQIEILQVDIQELETKLNLAVGDVNQLTVKLNAVIVDLRNLYEALMGSGGAGNEYSPSGGTSTDGLLTRLDELYTVFWDHIHMPPFSSTLQTYRSSHPPYVPSSNPGSPSHTSGSKPTSLTGMSQSTVIAYNESSDPSFPDAGRNEAAVTGLYTPAVQDKVAIVLKSSGERRARHLARKIQGQITEEDRVHKTIS